MPTKASKEAEAEQTFRQEDGRMRQRFVNSLKPGDWELWKWSERLVGAAAQASLAEAAALARGGAWLAAGLLEGGGRAPSVAKETTVAVCALHKRA